MGPARSDELGAVGEIVPGNADVLGGAGSRSGAEGPYRRECRDILGSQERVARMRKDLQSVIDNLGPRGTTEKVARLALELVG